MKTEFSNSNILRQVNIVSAKSIQIKKGLSISDLMQLKSKKHNLKKAVLVGEMLLVESN